MFEEIVTKIVAIFAAIPFSASTWFVLFILGFFVWLFMRAHRNTNSRVNWEDLIVDTKTNKVTPYKVGYLIGVIVGTWITIKLADTNKLTFDIFGFYLAYLVGGAGWMAIVNKKQENGNGGINGYGNGGMNNQQQYQEPEQPKKFGPPPPENG